MEFVVWLKIEERLEQDDKFDEDAKITNTILRCNASDVKVRDF
jgi:hypothetical protein